MCSKNNLMATEHESHLGIKALASSAVSGHRLAKHASSNLWSFFLPSKLQLQEINASKKRSLFICKILAWKKFSKKTYYDYDYVLRYSFVSHNTRWKLLILLLFIIDLLLQLRPCHSTLENSSSCIYEWIMFIWIKQQFSIEYHMVCKMSNQRFFTFSLVQWFPCSCID